MLKCRLIHVALMVGCVAFPCFGKNLPPRGTNSAASGDITLSPVERTTIKAGASRDDVVKTLGGPRGTVTAGTMETLIYDRGDVVLNGGVVASLNVVTYGTYKGSLAKPATSNEKPADGQKKPWYSAITGMFHKKEGASQVEGPPVKLMTDLALRYHSEDNIKWKVLLREPSGLTGYVRVEGPAGHSTQFDQPFEDRECACRISGNILEVEYLSYRTQAKLEWVKMFTIVNRNLLKCNDPKLFPGEIVPDETK